MKKFILLVAVILSTSCATNTSFNTFYQNHEDDSNFSFGLSSSLIANFLPDEDLEDIKPLLKKAKHIRILVFSDNAEDKSDKFDKFINRSKFEEMVKLKSENDKLAFFTLEKKDRIKEIVLEISSGEDLVLIGLKTNLTQEDLDNLIQTEV
ncbi:DUF4252 domain-containing protein [Lutimonas saemankumensis]|uniref:DUF4252 domain-containing protein n=1 Tax=Lutimonas saemankumensis TaxID=483016 RepID=UPI001CD611E0|nr:DUF4252 domain-containing protein [Lutimonas saemankumensis]MCA0933147.1 DUF4252 domain-containing protein [Lutimonas saemankumensis]